MRIALIESGTVVNVVEAPEGWQPPAGLTARELLPGEQCGPGFTFDGLTFAAPAPRPPLTDVEELSATVVALALLALDEINLLRQWVTSFKGAAAAATSLANLQTRIAALPNTPDRSRAQLLAAVRAKLTDGSV